MPALLILSMLFGLVLKQSQFDNKSDKYISNGQNEYVYSPRGSLFQVVFKRKPEILKTVPPDSSSVLNSEIAELDLDEDDSYLKAEFVLFNRIIDTISSAKKIALVKWYAKENDLSYPDITYNEKKTVKFFELKGSKDMVDVNNRKLKIRLGAQFYFYKTNLFILYGLCEAKNFPTVSISRFYSSVKLKE